MTQDDEHMTAKEAPHPSNGTTKPGWSVGSTCTSGR